jgi:anti-sigma factor RsiW
MHPDAIAINDYADDALTPAERADVERHLASCADCRALVDDLRDIRRAAGSLEQRDAPVRAWARIERAIQLEAANRASGAEGDARENRPRVEGRARFARSRSVWLGLAAAAVLVLATAAGWRFLPRAQPAGGTANSPGVVINSDAAQVEAELRQAEAHYEKAIQGLEQIANAEKGALDPKTAATLQKNLSVIDQAISESRAALRAEPTSEPAQMSLIDSFKTKMGLLQDTVALINDMRRGNEAGAARIVSGLKTKG